MAANLLAERFAKEEDAAPADALRYYRQVLEQFLGVPDMAMQWFHALVLLQDIRSMTWYRNDMVQ